MSYTVINHKEVKNDVLQAKDWYKSQQKGLEKRFAKAEFLDEKALFQSFNTIVSIVSFEVLL